MTIFKKNIFFTLIASFALQPIIHADFKNWYKDKPDKETYEAAQRLAEQEIEKQLKPHEQQADIKEHILVTKSKQAEQIKKALLGSLYLSKTEVKEQSIKYAKEAAKEKALELLFNKTTQALELMLQKLNKVATKEQILQILEKVNKKVEDEILWGWAPDYVLRKYTKSDSSGNSELEKIIAQEIKNLPNAFKEKYFTEDDIIEVYPEHKTAEIELKKQRGEIHRSKDCRVCFESFNTLGKRVNLECGHGVMCLKCAAINIHLYKKYECPICRAQVDPKDFTVRYLKQNMKEYDYKIFEKLDQDTMKQIMDLFKRV